MAPYTLGGREQLDVVMEFSIDDDSKSCPIAYRVEATRSKVHIAKYIMLLRILSGELSYCPSQFYHFYYVFRSLFF